MCLLTHLVDVLQLKQKRVCTILGNSIVSQICNQILLPNLKIVFITPFCLTYVARHINVQGKYKATIL